MLGHQLHTGEMLLPPLPLGSAASSLQEVGRLSPAAAAHHAAKGDAYSYAGTLVVATREPDPVLATTTTTLLYADPRVIQHDIDGLLVALGSALSAPRLILRAGHGTARDQRRGPQLRADVLDKVPAVRTLHTGVDCTIAAATELEEWEYARGCIRGALSYDGRATAPRIDRYLVDDMGLADPVRSTTLVARWRGDLAGHITWMVRTDAFDRERRAEVVDVTATVGGVIGLTVVQQLIAAMEQAVARTPGLGMRLTVPEVQTAQLAALVNEGWTLVHGLYHLDPWIHEGARVVTLP